jgi:hypothetical protein
MHSRNSPTLELNLTESELKSSECVNLPSRVTSVECTERVLLAWARSFCQPMLAL